MWTAILDFFAVGAIGFWLFVILASIVYVISVELDKYSAAIGLTVLAVIIWHRELMEMCKHWEIFGIGVLAYGIAGGIWSIFRWFRYCKKFVAESMEENWTSRKPEERLSLIQDRLNLRHHKSRITGWIVFWPWSLVWNITGDFFTMIYDSLKGIYQKIANSIVEKAMESFKPKNVYGDSTDETKIKAPRYSKNEQ